MHYFERGETNSDHYIKLTRHLYEGIQTSRLHKTIHFLCKNSREIFESKQHLKQTAQSCFEECCPKARGLLRSWRSGLMTLFYAIRWADLPRKIPSRCWLICNSCHAQGHNKKNSPCSFDSGFHSEGSYHPPSEYT